MVVNDEVSMQGISLPDLGVQWGQCGVRWDQERVTAVAVLHPVEFQMFHVSRYDFGYFVIGNLFIIFVTENAIET